MLEIPMEVNRVTVQNVKNANEQPCRTEAKTCKITRRDHRANGQYRVTRRNNNVRLRRARETSCHFYFGAM